MGVWASVLLLEAITQAFAVTALAADASAKDYYHEIAEHFRKGCPANLSEDEFKKYFTSVGARVENVDSPKYPFSIVATNSQKGYMATYFRAPYKCCISVMNANRDKFLKGMMRDLPLKNPKTITVKQRTLVLFQPNFTNRMLSVDWDKSFRTGNEIANLCQTDFPNADKEYFK